MILKSFGCSFVFGTELSDIGSNIAAIDDPRILKTHSKLTWPALLAQSKNHKYMSYAKPGSGNLNIADTVLSHVVDNSADIFVIQWTWIDRFDYVADQVPNRNTFHRWKTLQPSQDTELNQMYFGALHSQYRDKLTSLMAIKAVVDMLQHYNRRFVMTYVDDLLWESQYQITPAIEALQTALRPVMTSFEGQSFWKWCQQNQFPLAPGNHPKEAAHQAAFELIKSYNLV